MIQWNIVSVDTAKVADYVNAVVMARWVCKAVSGDKTAVQIGATALNAPSGNFIPYDKLTEADILGFCFGDGLQKSAIEAKAQDQLEQMLSGPSSPPLPWEVVAEEQLVS
jgi:hypothetical protein